MKYILILLLTSLLFSCKNAEKTTENTIVTKVKPVITKPSKVPVVLKESLFLTMERTPCFGTCPSYKIFIFNTGNVIFEGYSNTKYIGKFNTQLTKKQLKEIQQMMDEIDITGMRDVYDSEVTDFPSTILFLVSNNRHRKKILDRVDAPASLKQFEKLIDFLVLNDQLIQLPTNK
ncbi:MAG: DUF6438 domain-containing protein [Flavobacteriales bacterium]